MKELAIRGHGFVGNKLLSLSQGQYIPRDWTGLFGDVIYTAAYGNYYDQKDLYKTYRVNVLEVIKLLKSSESFIYISTSSVLLPIQTPYSHSKKVMEEILKEVDIPACAIRPSSITGVGEQERHLIQTLIKSCLEGELIPFVTEPSHDFIDINDFCDGVLYISNNINKFKGKSLNLSSGKNYKNKEVLSMVEEITGSKANIKLVDSMRKYDTDEWIVKPDLEFSSKPLYLSIQEMVNEYRKNH